MSLNLVSTESASDPALRRSTRLLAMVHELHKVGYQRLRIAAGRSPETMDWRVRLLPSSAVSADGWTPEAESSSIDYSSAQESRFFGWADGTNDDARVLANKFLERMQPLALECWGRDWVYAGWFTEMLGRAEAGHLPVFYGVGSLTPPRHLPPGPPVPARRDASEGPSGNPYLLTNDEIDRGILPPPGASYERVWPFCLSYDATHGGLMSVAEYIAMSRQVEQRGLENATLDELRTVAYAHQRILKNGSGEVLPTDASMLIIHRVIEIIRRRL